jgi:hypothetical protein
MVTFITKEMDSQGAESHNSRELSRNQGDRHRNVPSLGESSGKNDLNVALGSFSSLGILVV